VAAVTLLYRQEMAGVFFIAWDGNTR